MKFESKLEIGSSIKIIPFDLSKSPSPTLTTKYENDETVSKETLIKKGLLKKAGTLVKVLGDGELTKKLTVNVDKVSASAKEKIEKIGGTVAISNE